MQAYIFPVQSVLGFDLRSWMVTKKKTNHQNPNLLCHTTFCIPSLLKHATPAATDMKNTSTM